MLILFCSSEDNSSYGEFLRRYYQWYSDVNRKSVYPPSVPGIPPPATTLPVAPTPIVPNSHPGPYDPLIHYEYIQRTSPYFLSPGLYPHPSTTLPPSGSRLPTASTAPHTYTSSFMSQVSATVVPHQTSQHLPNSSFTSLPPPHSLSGIGSLAPSVSSAMDCALGGVPNPAIKRSYDVTYLDHDKTEKQRKWTDGSLMTAQITHTSPYLSYPSLGLHNPSYLGWDRRHPTTSVDHTFMEYERHRTHFDAFSTMNQLTPMNSITSMHTGHSTGAFGMRPFVDSCKGMR